MMYSERFAGKKILILVYLPERKIFTLQINFLHRGRNKQIEIETE